MRVGLVLGAGGVVGASWLMGALEALESETGWRARSAETIIGTSAGSVVGAMLADGIEPALMGAYSAGRSLDGFAEAERRAGTLSERLEDMEYRIERGSLPLGPGSWRLAAASLLQPHRHPPAHLMSALMPRGFISTAPIDALMEQFVEGDWPDHPGYRAIAADFETGKRVAFGEPGAPFATAGQAVAASCSIPGFYCPVTIGGRTYVDGGICSASNVDLLRGQGLDLVVALNPMSSLAGAISWSPAEKVSAVFRAAAGRRLGHEAKKLREEGTEVLILQPSADDLRVMGTNLMSGARRTEVLEQAQRSTAAELRRLRVREDANRLLPRTARRRRLPEPAGARAAA